MKKPARTSFALAAGILALGVAAAAAAPDQPQESDADASGSCVSIPLQATGSTRGCCILRTQPARCIYASQSYCARKAGEAGVGFEFLGGESCAGRPECE